MQQTGGTTLAYSDLRGLLAEPGPSLSRSERAVAEIVLQDVQAALTQTITELAGRAGVSPPTVTRFCRRLGFASFQSFRLALAQMPPATSDALILDDPAAVADLVRGVASTIQKSITIAVEALDFDSVALVARLLAESRHIVFLGSAGASGTLAMEATSRFYRLGFAVSVCVDRRMMQQRARDWPADWLIVAFSTSGTDGALFEAIEAATLRSNVTIAIAPPKTPLAAVATHRIAIRSLDADGPLPVASRNYPFHAVLDALAMLASAERARR